MYIRQKGRKLSAEHKQKISIAIQSIPKEKLYTLERAAKISATHKARGIKPNPVFGKATQFKKGVKQPQWMIEKRVATVKGTKRPNSNVRRGKECHFWKGGKSKCIDCGKTIVVYKAKRCTQCNGKTRIGVNNPLWKGGRPNCKNCGKQKITYGKELCHKCAVPRGINSPNWIVDRTKLVKRQERNDSAYENWRSSVWKRDNWKCRMMNKDCNGRIEAHHILGWIEYPELRYEINNGITLCHAHHPRKRAEEKQLAPFFMGLIETKV